MKNLDQHIDKHILEMRELRNSIDDHLFIHWRVNPRPLGRGSSLKIFNVLYFLIYNILSRFFQLLA